MERYRLPDTNDRAENETRQCRDQRYLKRKVDKHDAGHRDRHRQTGYPHLARHVVAPGCQQKPGPQPDGQQGGHPQNAVVLRVLQGIAVRQQRDQLAPAQLGRLRGPGAEKPAPPQLSHRGQPQLDTAVIAATVQDSRMQDHGGQPRRADGEKRQQNSSPAPQRCHESRAGQQQAAGSRERHRCDEPAVTVPANRREQAGERHERPQRAAAEHPGHRRAGEPQHGGADHRCQHHAARLCGQYPRRQQPAPDLVRGLPRDGGDGAGAQQPKEQHQASDVRVPDRPRCPPPLAEQLSEAGDVPGDPQPAQHRCQQGNVHDKPEHDEAAGQPPGRAAGDPQRSRCADRGEGVTGGPELMPRDRRRHDRDDHRQGRDAPPRHRQPATAADDRGGGGSDREDEEDHEPELVEGTTRERAPQDRGEYEQADQELVASQPQRAQREKAPRQFLRRRALA